MVAWSIWATWNFILWHSKFKTSQMVVNEAEKFLSDWRQAQSLGRIILSASVPVIVRRTWTKPTTGNLKFNVDATLFQAMNSSGFAAVLRNDQGAFVRGVSLRQMGLREALPWLLDLQLSHVEVEVDSQLIFYACQSEVEDRSVYGSIIQDCNSLVCQGMFSFSWVYRDANRVAHFLARDAIIQENIRIETEFRNGYRFII
ncbi:hypothetical protein P3X46_032494 [Hevea brasiliensis]|uniref:RNase H type-1 domain-containing protein n=1 Tax=Hevea brasiliensis TaxID=3981 RepID=A0ABQ9KFC0_HEVBR|nr:hypothetical protein P3X46_032494 [Hevea brasiliensis]